MNLDLDTFEYEEEISIGTIQMEQIENGTKVAVELFPDNQSKESFEDAEFSKIYDLLELSIFRMQILTQFPVPKGTTEEDIYKISRAVANGVTVMLESIMNLEDFKGTMININDRNIPIYPILASLRGDYLFSKIMSFIGYRATEPIDIQKVSDDMNSLEAVYRIIDTINETDEQRTQNVLNYLKKRRPY